MTMLDWNAYRSQLTAGVAQLGGVSPDLTRGYATLNGAGKKTGKFDDKARELIALAVAVALRCDGCIAAHSKLARQLEATEDELVEALSIAVSVSAGAAIVYSSRTVDAFMTL